MWWNFIGRTHDEIAEARRDWRQGDHFGDVHGYDGHRLAAPELPPLPETARTGALTCKYSPIEVRVKGRRNDRPGSTAQWPRRPHCDPAGSPETRDREKPPVSRQTEFHRDRLYQS